MRRMFFLAIAAVIFAAAAFGFQNRGTQGGRGQQPAPNADPYANNASPGTTQFPLAAPAGKDSNAFNVAPPGAVNQGPFDPLKWKYGNAFDAPAGSKMRSTRERSLSSSRPSTPLKKRSKRGIGRTSRLWAGAAREAARHLMPRCGAMCREAIATRSTTMSS